MLVPLNYMDFIPYLVGHNPIIKSVEKSALNSVFLAFID